MSDTKFGVAGALGHDGPLADEFVVRGFAVGHLHRNEVLRHTTRRLALVQGGLADLAERTVAEHRPDRDIAALELARDKVDEVSAAAAGVELARLP